ncbi:MFS transporter [Nocardia sp. IFM 10818]
MASPHPLAATTTATTRWRGHIVLVLCFVAIVFDGYDLVVFGSTLPSILAYEPWQLTKSTAGVIGSLALVGMLIGTLAVSVLTDRLGRRRIMLISIAWFSILMLLTAAAPSPEAFALLRFLTGIGLGGVVPTCVALTVEFAPRRHRQTANAVMFSGYSVGGVGAATLALIVLPRFDFRLMYALGALSLITLLPLTWKLMPESVAYLARSGRVDEARATAAKYGLVYSDIVAAEDHGPDRARSSLATLFSRRWIASSILFALTNFCGLLLVYGLNTWLPQIMREAGFALGAALTFLLVLNAGAIAGAIGASSIADRIGAKRVVVTCFLLAALTVVLMSLEFPFALMLGLVALAGLGSIGTQILVGGYCSTHYPQSLTATALSFTLGFGRIGAITGPLIGGFLVGLGWGWQINFYAFAAFAVLGAATAFAVPRAPV